MERILNKVRKIDCSVCRQEGKELKGFSFTTLVGAVVATVINNYLYIVCEDCGREKGKESLNYISTGRLAVNVWFDEYAVFTF